MNQPRIATWRAVSSEEQGQEGKESLEYQQRLNLEHATKWNGIIVKELEVQESRSIILWEDACRKIEAYRDLNRLIDARGCDILMCQDFTRLARDRALVITLARLLENAGIRIYETTNPPSNIDGPVSTSDTRLLMMIKGHQSEEELRKFNERSYFGRQSQVKKGKLIHRRPIGLKRAYDESGEIITVIDEEWSHLVQLYFDLLLNHGRSMRAIANEFNARGYLTPDGQPWDFVSVKVFYRNRWTYAGFASWGHRSRDPDKAFRVKAEWPALITEEMALWAERENSARARMPRSVGAPQRFSATAKCDMCNSTIVVHDIGYGKNSDRTWTRYRCLRLCLGGSIGERVLYEAVYDAIILLQDKMNLDALVGETPNTYELTKNDLKQATQEIDALAEERERLTVAFMRKVITFDEFETHMATSKERQKTLQHTKTQLEAILANTPTAETRRARLEEIRDKGLEMLAHPDVSTANSWIRQHFVLYVANNQVVGVKAF